MTERCSHCLVGCLVVRDERTFSELSHFSAFLREPLPCVLERFMSVRDSFRLSTLDRVKCAFVSSASMIQGCVFALLWLYFKKKKSDRFIREIFFCHWRINGIGQCAAYSLTWDHIKP